ncbi:Transketolase, C-terminal domain [Flavobacterium fluvii]|uniref:Transketolase, C-terminal domain n=1 Tax=Flavobacterium fluvii TaxID=468056 RepID=A0A1M5MC48_9FLAO|nr:Transketolase, C-terminal domain [Flavobacterium fluvii]
MPRLIEEKMLILIRQGKVSKWFSGIGQEDIYASVMKTGRAIILQEDSLFWGIASDISALIMENCFPHLDAPVRRVASLDSPIPFTKTLEEQYLPKGRFENELLELLKY